MSQFCIVLDRACEFVMVTLRTFFVLGVLSSAVVIFLCGSVSEVLAASEEIHQLSPCACKIGDKIIDLSPLGNRNNTPRFRDVLSAYPFQFSWNPCYSFDENGCRGVAGCQVVMFPRQYFSLGTQSSATFVRSDDGELQLVYESDPKEGFRRILHVKLVCTKEGEEQRLVANGERPAQQAVYDLTLYDRHACPRSPESQGLALSTGSILLITVLLLVLLYVASGVLFQIFVRKSSGVQVIPHIVFWSTVPGLVKDGCLFVVKRGKVSEMYQAVD